jgi:hypothetical protein
MEHRWRRRSHRAVFTMPLSVDGITYFSTAEVLTTLKISRVTFWRWRSGRRIPPGSLLRGRQLVFTAEELMVIRNYANRVVPISEREEQLRLFGPRN